jgi:hypothetical protein
MLDSLSNVRPEMLKMKKRHLNIDEIGVEPLSETLHYMRINAERERIARYRQVAEECALLYYNIMEQFSNMQDKITTG